MKRVKQHVKQNDTFVNEPHRSRTCNLLIKRDEPLMLLDVDKCNSASSGQKMSLGYYLIYYLVPYGVVQFVGKMLAKILSLIWSVTRQDS